jgi:hypothetical protein
MAVDASLDSLRAMVGAQSTKDDALLADALQTAGEHIRGKVYPESWNTSPVQHAVLLLANRLYKRRQSPEATAGFGAEGLVVRIAANDPDVRSLLEDHLDLTKAGVA